MRDNSKTRNRRPKGSGGQAVYGLIQDRILSLKLLPGQEIDEKKLIDELGVSRTPVREALIRLAADGIVEIVPNQGIWVARLRTKDIPELLEALEICLRISYRWAAERHTRIDIQLMLEKCKKNNNTAASRRVSTIARFEIQFLEAIVRATHNRYAITGFRTILPSFLRLNYSLLSNEERARDDFNLLTMKIGRVHKEIVDAIAAGDIGKADDLALAYTNNIRERVTRYFESNDSVTTQ